MALALLLFAPGAYAAECSFNGNGNWTITSSCDVSGLVIAPRNLTIDDNSTVTVMGSGTLIVDTRSFALRVRPGSRLLIRPSGKFTSNQIGPRMMRLTDGGLTGYFLKRVGGAVVTSRNRNVSFHPDSTIKVLYMLEALRAVNSNTLNLNTTQLNLCPSVVIASAGGTTCPVSFAATGTTASGLPNTGAGGAGGNCTTVPAAVANTATNCGGALVSRSLGTSLCAMMKVSNNQTANAIQELVGGGNPTMGWSNMISNAGQAVGLTSTTFGNRMGCGGPNNPPPINLTTLSDLGRIFEGMANNPVVLNPNNPPTNVNFPTTQAYLFMDNNGNTIRDGLVNPLNAIIAEQASELGLSAATTTAFINLVQFVHKRGANITKDMDGDGLIDADTDGDGAPNRDPRDYRSMAGWLSLPINSGAATRDYVFGLFFNDIDSTSSIGNLLNDAPEMFRPILRSALRDF